MAVKLEFDHANVVNAPTIVLAKKGGKKLGTIPATSIHFDDNFNSMNTITFKVNNENSGIKTRLWNEIKNFKLIWCKEWDAWFEITVEIDESNELIKNIEGHSIGESELSAIKLYNIHINTEEDIALDDYVSTVLYDDINPKASLLNRIIGKTPHYTIKHVDSSIASIQRTFSFNDMSILDAFNEIGKEIGCIFILSQSSGSDGNPERGIYVYDLMNYCESCGYREDGISVCPECGSENIRNGYGLDTNVFVSNENLAKEITLTTDVSSVNNCFKLDTGDDLMSATVVSCNPNGTEYLWYITEETKSDMSNALSEKLSQYDALYSYYQNEYQTSISSSLISDYNTLITKYQTHKSDLPTVSNAIGFSNLINIIYNAIDFELFLTSGLMPSIEISDTSASQEAALLTANSLSPVSVANLTGISSATVDANVLALAKAIIRSTYKVSIKTSSFNSGTSKWTGVFTVENYSDEEDVADSSSITITITDDYEKYIEQKIKKLLSKSNDDSYDITGLFNKAITVSGNTYSGAFANELKKYALHSLKSFHENCQSCIDVLSEEGISNATNWLNSNPNLYQQFYKDYYNKLKAIEAEIKLRESEITKIKDLSNAANNTRNSIQEELDFEDYIGTTLWKEFCSYRRETTYSNQNYVSDGLSNAELLNRAREFLLLAQKELIKSATLQHSISTTLNNLLVIKEFQPIVNAFKVGNWIRVRIDGQIYKLRLIGYSIDFDELDELSVEFSDVINCGNDLSDIQSVLNQASSMAASYQSVERQAGKGEETNKTVKSWLTDGLNATLTRIMNDAETQNMTFDNHGMLMRKYDDVSETYDDEQLRILNSTILITTDNWETTKTAVGKFYYIDPSTGNLKQAYGINGETIVGKLIIGESLALYNNSNTLKFNANGLEVTNNTNTFKVNPNAAKLITLSKGNAEIFSVDSSGDLTVTGAIVAKTLSTGSRTSSATGTAGTFITPAGAIYVGDNNQTIISPQGKITTRNILIYGNDDNTSCTIYDELTFKHDEVASYVRLARFLELSDIISGVNIYDSFSIYGNEIQFSQTNNGSWRLIYSGGGQAQIIGSLIMSGSFISNSSVTSGGNVYLGLSNVDGHGGVYAGSNSAFMFGCSSDGNNNEIVYIGGVTQSESGFTGTYLRGEVVRIYSYSSGAVYLGSSGSTAVTSDENLKDIFNIDDKYIDFFNAINPVAYKYKVGHRTHIGFGAQSIENALKKSGLTTEDFAGILIDRDVNIGEGERLLPDNSTHFDELYSLRYEEFIALNTMMIKSLQNEIASLKDQISKYK